MHRMLFSKISVIEIYYGKYFKNVSEFLSEVHVSLDWYCPVKVLCSKCSPSNIRRNETNDQHSFLVQWLIRLPGKQEVHGSIPCEGRVLFFCSVLWSYHHVAISVIRTRQTITSERIITESCHLFLNLMCVIERRVRRIWVKTVFKNIDPFRFDEHFIMSLEIELLLLRKSVVMRQYLMNDSTNWSEIFTIQRF